MVLDNGQFPCGRLRTFKSAAPGGETTVGYFYLRESDPAAGASGLGRLRYMISYMIS
jgi:hypothetical protein